MPVYRFHIVPEDGIEDIQFRFADDNAALQTAKVMLREIARKAARNGRSLSKTLEVLREDGTRAGIASPATDPAFDHPLLAS